MQIIPNWTKIQGSIIGFEKSIEVKNHTVAEIEIVSKEDVPGFKNLISQTSGERLKVNIPDDLIKDHTLQPGMNIKSKVRMARPKKLIMGREDLSVDP